MDTQQSDDKSATLEVRRVKLSDLKPHPRNPRNHPDPGSEEWNALKKSLKADYFDPLVVNSGKTHAELSNVLVSGHLRCKVLISEGYTHADAVVKDYDEARHVQVMLRANNQTGTWDEKILADLLNGIGKDDLDLTGFDGAEIDRLLAGLDGGKTPDEVRATLAEQFIVPPFSVMDARQGYWQDRKRAWLALGIKSELGRGSQSGTSARAADGDIPTYRQRGNAATRQS